MALPVNGQQLTITVSFGVAKLNDSMSKPSELFDRADSAFAQSRSIPVAIASCVPANWRADSGDFADVQGDYREWLRDVRAQRQS